MKRMAFIFLVMLFTVTQVIAELEKDLVVYFPDTFVTARRSVPTTLE